MAGDRGDRLLENRHWLRHLGPEFRVVGNADDRVGGLFDYSSSECAHVSINVV